MTAPKMMSLVVLVVAVLVVIGVAAAVPQYNNRHLLLYLLCFVIHRFTPACRRGRTTIVTMRCDLQHAGNGTVELPSKCPDGTCDGCVYLFLWKSQFACPRCSRDNFTEVVEECSGGKQKVVLLKPKYDFPSLILIL